MRILYGVVGEGMGHAIRSRVILEELTQKHEVQIVASGRAHDFLKRRFEGAAKVNHIWGLTLNYHDNEVKKFATAVQNVRGALAQGGLPENLTRYFQMMLDFAPQVVISDFESWSYLFALSERLPVISIDNMQIINRCAHDESILTNHHASFQLAKTIVKAKCPFASHYLVSTFFYAPVRKDKTTLVPPILRPDILAARAQVRQGDHLLVYQTSDTNSRLPAILATLPVPCHVYGLRRDLARDVIEGNITYRPFSEAAFIEDLATARGVLAGGGFTLMGEAIYLRKPFLAVPLAGQFEQIINGRYLEQLGYGAMVEELTSDAAKTFLEKIPDYQRALASYDQEGNTRLFSELETLLDRAAGGLL